MLPAALTLALMAPQSLQYPKAKTVDTVDIYHGVAVADPYRWLERPISNSEVKKWVTAENKLTFSYLDKIPGRDRLLKTLEGRINFERFTVPTKEGGRVFYSRNSGLQNQDVLYVVDGDGMKPRVLLDPNTLSKDGTVALSGMDISKDGKRLLYGLASAGSDWLTWHVKDVATGKDLGDEVKWSKFGGGTINADGSAFYYLRYPEPKGTTEFTAANTNPSIYEHKVGTPQDQDRLVLNLPDHPDWFIFPALDPDKTTLFLILEEPGSLNNHIWLQDLTKPNAPVVKLLDANDANYNPVHVEGSAVYVQTDKDAPKGKIIKVDYIKRIGPVDVIPESKDTLEGASVIGGKLVATYMQDARSAVRVFGMDGTFQHEVKLPGLGSVSGFGGQSDDPVTYYSYTGFTDPATIYTYNVDRDQSVVFRKPKLPFDTSKYESKQVFVTSKDLKVKIPLFIVYKKGVKLDGTNPTLLYGYGGFGISNTPWFSTSRTAWLDMGGVWALADIRGGGEYGKEWHEAAIKTKRQNAYDDFISCAEWLIDNKYTKPARLAIQGGSNGGLLIGVCVNQRPDLFGVAIPEVGVMDMLRFNQFTIGKAWESDYGSPSNLAEFFALYRISPYHNLTPNTNYPAVLVTTADTDDRVVPAHSFKYTARLQACQAADKPVLIRVETAAGHGGGKPISKQLEEIRDIFAFILYNMGVKIPTALK